MSNVPKKVKKSIKKVVSKTAKNRNDTSSKAKFVAKPKKQKKSSTKGEYKGIEYDSLEELAFLQWASELQKLGYIKSIKRSESFLLSDSIVNNYSETRGTSSTPKTQTVLQGHSYTPEFEIIWTQKSRDILIWELTHNSKFEKIFIGTPLKGGHEFVTFIEVKPLWDQNNMERLFKLNQKWMYQKHNIFVNLVKCPTLFEKTFTPKEFLTTKTGRDRKIGWRVKTIYEFLNPKK